MKAEVADQPGKSKPNWLEFLRWKAENNVTKIDLMNRPLTKKEFEELVTEYGIPVWEIKNRIVEMEAFTRLIPTYVSAAITIQLWPNYKNKNHNHA